MSNIQIPNLGAAIALNGTEQFEAVQAGTSVKVTAAQLGTYVQSLGFLSVGTSTIANGSSGRPLYDNGGVLGEYALIPIGFGGTNSSATPTLGGVAYGTGASYAFTAAGTAGQFLQSTGSAQPTWTQFTSVAGAPGFYGSFYDADGDQIAGNTTTAYPITIGSTVSSNGVSIVSGTRITFANAGVYTLNPSIMFTNTATQDHDIDMWFRKNGTDVPNSNSQFTIPAKHSGVNGNAVATSPFVISLSAGDYIEIMWRTDSTAVYIHTYAAGTSPTRPVIPGVIVSTTSQPQIGLGYAGLTSTTSTAIGIGSKTFTTNLTDQQDAYVVGSRVRVAYASDTTKWMEGVITAYSGSTLTVNVDSVAGSGTYASWNFSIAGIQGNSGLTVGSTTVGGGTSGRILYDNAGVLGEYTAQGAAVQISAEYVVADLAALKALTTPYPAAVETKCRATAGDQGGGVWVFRTGDQSANITADTQSGIWAAPNSAPTGASGAWQRQYDGVYSAAWFGAFPDGSDAKTALTAAINALPATGGTVLLDTGNYKISGAIALTRGAFTLRGQVGTSLECSSTTENHITVGAVGGPYLFNVQIEQVMFTRTSACSAGWAIDFVNVGFSLIRNIRVYGDNKQYQGIRLRSCNTINFENIRTDNIQKEHAYLAGLSSTPAGVDGTVVNIFVNNWYIAGAHAASGSLATQGAFVLDDFCGGVWLNMVACDSARGYAVYLKGTLPNIADNQLIYIDELNVEATYANSGALRVDNYRGVYLTTDWISGNDLDTIYIGTNANTVFIECNSVAIAYDSTEKAAIYCDGSGVEIYNTQMVGYSTNAHNTGLSLGTNADRINVVGGSFYQLNKGIDAVTYTGGKIYNITGSWFSGNVSNTTFTINAAQDFQFVSCNGISNVLRGSVFTSNQTITSSSANALVVGANGSTNPAFNVDASTASSATGINIKSAAAAGGVAFSVLSSGTNENLKIDAKGSGTITLGGTSTGAITMSQATTFNADATISVNQNSTANYVINNSNTGASAGSRLYLSTGTANSNASFAVNDNGGSPYAVFAFGSGITATYFDNSNMYFRDGSGNNLFKLDASNVTISKPLIYGGKTLANTATGDASSSMVLSANPTLSGTVTVTSGDISVQKTSGSPGIQGYSYQAAGYAPPQFQLTRRNASLGATPDNSAIGQVRFDGSDANNSYALFAMISVSIGTNAAGGAPADMTFETSSSGASTSERMRIDSRGNVSINTAAVATNATDGFLYIPTCAGTPTGTPTSKTGVVPLVYDCTNNKLYIYNGAWKSATFA